MTNPELLRCITVRPEVFGGKPIIRFKETTVTTKHMAEGIATDYGADSYLAAIELLDITRHPGYHTVFKQIILEDVAFRKALMSH
jgi:hypothetical protein